MCLFKRGPQRGITKIDGEHVYVIVIMGSAQGSSSLHRSIMQYIGELEFFSI
jgi:UDP-N-acetylglucosamine:LPS N-acetylglucosamine transferase